MERIVPQWQPNERECLHAILETMIDEGLLATRSKLGETDVVLVDVNFWMNVGLDVKRLPQQPDIMRMLVDFLPYFWLPDDRRWICRPLDVSNEAAAQALPVLWEALNLSVHPDGNLLMTDLITPALAEVITRQAHTLERIITLVGPGLHYACTTWHLRPEQYKALISWDTLAVLDPHVRWNMIYGSRLL